MSALKSQVALELSLLREGALEIITEEELKERLECAHRESRPLRVKLGIDASGPEIHLGFAVVLRKLRQFQELGHTAVLVVGDFTGMIGDPTGRSRTRPQLTLEEMRRNIKNYKEQIFKILMPERTEFLYNSQWLSKLTTRELVTLTAHYTVARLLEREDFEARLKSGDPLFVHELLYPLFQGYDSVMVRADIELGGQDQRLNHLVGRELQRSFGQPPQVILLMPLLEGTDGLLKMSKSFGNYIGITEPPREMYGKLMSIPDSLILKYFALCTDQEPAGLKTLQARLEARENPRNLKAELAWEVVKLYHSAEAATRAKEEFERIFKTRGLPDQIPEFQVHSNQIEIVELLVSSGLVPSRSEARRKLRQGAVYLDGQRITDENLILNVKGKQILKLGKRQFLKIGPTG
jgi:tyrosyl-tRNA synthetase